MAAIAVISLILAIAAIVLTVTVERLKRSKIEIVPSVWIAPSFVQWTFATVRIRNKELWPVVRWFLERRPAQGCRIKLEYFDGDSTLPFLRIDGRWSSSDEPIGWVPSSLTSSPTSAGSAPDIVPLTAGPPVTGAPLYQPLNPTISGGTAPTTRPSEITPFPSSPPPTFRGSGTTGSENDPKYKLSYTPSRAPGPYDITADPEGEEVAVAILREGEVFAFSTASYQYPLWGNPDWKLDLKQIYRIRIRVSGAGVIKEATFKLDCLDPDPSNFQLEPQ
jgi:hypothetical protein